MTKSTIFTMGVDEQTLARWKAAADHQGLSVAQWIESNCNAALAPAVAPASAKPSATAPAPAARVTADHFDQLLLQVRNSVYMVESATQRIQSHTHWLAKKLPELGAGPIPG
jgi:hypothetical protein